MTGPSSLFAVKRGLIAGTVYFLALFALGFALGTIRVLFVAPRFGELAATLAEVPVMLAAALFTCRWAIRRWHVPQNGASRWTMVTCFLGLLLLFETLLGTLLFGRSAADQWTLLTRPAGLIGLCAQIIAALLPVIVGRNQLLASENRK
jgi:hypothetical protein